ncbi:MAG: enoyl-CoA hydratase/isomerase family protein [Acidimicrobiales bacterium]
MPTLTVTAPRPGVRLLTLDRPQRLNALDAVLVGELHAALDAADADRSCRVVILTGAGRGFCAGVDLAGYGIPPGAAGLAGAAATKAEQEHLSSLVPHLRRIRPPVIAAVNGPAAGAGLALVLGSDLRIAGASARFGTAFVRVGYSAADAGTSWLLPRIVGLARAHELMLTARMVEAAEAERIGLVTSVVPDGELLPAALSSAETLLGWDPWAVETTKQAMWATADVPSLDAAVALENAAQVMCVALGEGATPPGAAPG